MWFVFYAGGNIAGANIFFTREAPRYFSTSTELIVCYVLIGGCGASFEIVDVVGEQAEG